MDYSPCSDKPPAHPDRPTVTHQMLKIFLFNGYNKIKDVLSGAINNIISSSSKSKSNAEWSILMKFKNFVGTKKYAYPLPMSSDSDLNFFTGGSS